MRYPGAAGPRRPVSALTRLERYFSREVVPPFLIGVALYVCLFLVQSLLARGEYLANIPPAQAARWLAYQVPNFAVQSFPLATVFAVLIGFGRLARDRELLAARSGAIPVQRTLRPVIAGALLLVATALAMAEWVVPRANELTAVTWWDGVDGGGQALARVAGQDLSVGPYRLRFDAYDAASQTLRGVRVERWDGRVVSLYFSSRASLRTEDGRGVIELRGYEAYRLDTTGLKDATRVAQLLQFSTVAPDPESVLSIKLPQTRDAIIARNAGGGFDDTRSISALWNEYRAAKGPLARPAGVELATRTAVPFANLVILLLAIPLAASATRSAGMAFGLTFIVTIAYYAVLYAGRSVSLQGLLPPLVGPWLANLGFLAFGVWFMRRARFS
ncbi:MAG TPA: LptF/LptG family permease [Deinococcales bacterium]|nr:LptF/LptG family permease [Deinococcales bacterium]